MTKARTYKSEIIKDLLSETSEEELKLTEKKMLLAARIADAVKTKYRHRGDFADAIGKKSSEVSKWLSGTHNFTSETLFNIERVLEIQLLYLEPRPTTYITYHISMRSDTQRPGSYNIVKSDQGMQIITYKGESIVSETKPEYVTD